MQSICIKAVASLFEGKDILCLFTFSKLFSSIVLFETIKLIHSYRVLVELFGVLYNAVSRIKSQHYPQDDAREVASCPGRCSSA